MLNHNYCSIHHTGSLKTPCAWPECPNGHPTDVYISTSSLSPKEYKRESFIAPDGAPRFFWISDTESYGWVIRQVVRDEFTRLAYKDISTIHHYTTLEGLQGIIESSDLWLTESAFLNDASEVKHGIELSREIFEKIQFKDSPIKNYLQQVVDTPEDKLPRINIACFSTARDSLSQWRAYGGGVGVSIVFETKNFLRSFGYPDCRLNNVLYDNQKKRALLETYLRFHFEAYQRDSNRTIRVLERDLTYRTHLPITGYDTTLQYSYFELVTLCKHSDFNDEHEVRLSYTEHDNVLSSFDLTPTKTRFRKGNGFLVPYTTIDDIRTAGRRELEKERLPITEVMIAPHPRSELAALSVKRFLDHHGYKTVPVVRSQSPYR